MKNIKELIERLERDFKYIDFNDKKDYEEYIKNKLNEYKNNDEFKNIIMLEKDNKRNEKLIKQNNNVFIFSNYDSFSNEYNVKIILSNKKEKIKFIYCFNNKNRTGKEINISEIGINLDGIKLKDIKNLYNYAFKNEYNKDSNLIMKYIIESKNDNDLKKRLDYIYNLMFLNFNI